MGLLSVKFLNTESHTMIDAGRLPVACIQDAYTLCTAFCQCISKGSRNGPDVHNSENVSCVEVLKMDCVRVYWPVLSVGNNSFTLRKRLFYLV